MLFVLCLVGGVPFSGRTAVLSNDNFASATSIYGLTNFAASNIGATAEPGEPMHGEQPAAYSLWWKWTVPFTASFRIVTSNSFVTNRIGLDTTLSVYKGSALTNLVSIVSNDDTDFGEFGATWSRVVFRAYAGETLFVAADSIGTNGSIQMRISLAGPTAAPWQVTNLQGQVVYSTNFNGKVVMIDFWETTCQACIDELPDLINVQYTLSTLGFTFFGLSGDTDPQIVNQYLASHKISYPIAMSNPSVQDKLAGGPVGYPTKVLLDREGRIVGQYLGGHTRDFYLGIIDPLVRTDPALRANIARTNGAVNIFWPASEPGYTVQASSNAVQGMWSSLGTPVVTNNQYLLTVTNNTAAQFFRLVKP